MRTAISPWHDAPERLTPLEASNRRDVATLTPREQDVLALLALGAPHKDIARELGIGLHTAKMHAKRAGSKRGCATSLELALSCYGVPPWSQRAVRP